MPPKLTSDDIPWIPWVWKDGHDGNGFYEVTARSLRANCRVWQQKLDRVTAGSLNYVLRWPELAPWPVPESFGESDKRKIHLALCCPLSSRVALQTSVRDGLELLRGMTYYLESLESASPLTPLRLVLSVHKFRLITRRSPLTFEPPVPAGVLPSVAIEDNSPAIVRLIEAVDGIGSGWRSFRPSSAHELAESPPAPPVGGDREGESNAQIPKARITKAKADAQARKYIDKHRNREQTRNPVSLRELASHLDCSTGLAAKLPAWRALQETREQKRQPKKPKVVSFTEKIEAVTGQADEELQRLIEEQAADFEPSPLDPLSKRVRERKRL
jgi:hypothetical protein